MSGRIVEGRGLKAIRPIELSEPETGKYHTQNKNSKELV